jgi:hypothetical protein
MMRTKARWAPPLDQDVSVVQGDPAARDAMARRLRPSCKRSEPRQRAMADRRGWLSPAERTNRWPRADVTGDATPYAFQHRRRRALWAPEAVRDERRHALVPHLGAPEAVRVLDETGLLTNGRHAAGGARPYRGTAGTVEHGQIGVWLGSAGQLGQAVRARALSRPQAWTTDRARCRQAGIPDARGVVTQPQLAQHLLARAGGAGGPATWGTGDRVDGDDRRLRRWLAAQPQADVLAVAGTAYVWLNWRPRQVNTIVASLPEDGWTRLRAGDGTTGPRWYAWRGLPWADPQEPGWRRWLRVRRRVRAPQELQASGVVALQQTAVTAVVRVAGTRGTSARGVEAATGAVGVDQDAVRSWTGW